MTGHPTRTAGQAVLPFRHLRPARPEPIAARRRFRTIWISDVHLGTRGCNAGMLIDFLDRVDSDTLYLVGDIIDGWRLKKRVFWPAAHNDVLWRLLKRARRGTRVVYIPGNHDEVFRQFAGLDFGGIAIRRQAIDETAAGPRLLVLPGAEVGAVTVAQPWLAHVGDTAYQLLMLVNRWFNAGRRALGLPYWSLSKHAKARVKNAVAFISRFEEVVARAAGSRGVDGVVCGHIHTAETREIGGVAYYNDGDWVESCTALVEHGDGTMELLHWADMIAARGAPALAAAA